jgi:amidase
MGAVRGLMEQPGPMARHLADLALMLPVLIGPDGQDHTVVLLPVNSAAAVDLTRLRVAYYTDSGIMPATPETVAAVKAAAHVLTEARATVTEDRPLDIAHTLSCSWASMPVTAVRRCRAACNW